MLYVADTHVLIWYLLGSDRLPEALRAKVDELRQAGGRLLVPTIVLAEALYIAEKGRDVSDGDDGVLDFDALYKTVVEDPGFDIVGFGRPILEEAIRTTDVPELHDRIITATARFYGAGILTKDREIPASEP